MPIIDLFKAEKIVSIIGLAKNTGKTVTLNKVLNEVKSANKFFGVTSIGRDGEQFDVINNTIKKPLIFIPAGHYIATADRLLAKSKAEVAMLATTNFRTPLGTVVVGKVLQGGTIEVAGPSTVKGTKTVCDLMLQLGADIVFVDGAVNRKAISSSLVCDGTIIATGAVLDTNMANVVHETIGYIKLINLPVVDDKNIKEIALTMKGPLLVDRNYKTFKIDKMSIHNNAGILPKIISDGIRYIIFDTSLGEHIIDNIYKYKEFHDITFIINDFTKLFISPIKIHIYEKKGISIQVVSKINIISVTVNPVSTRGYTFDSDQFVSMMKDALPDIPVFDVMHPSYDTTFARFASSPQAYA